MTARDKPTEPFSLARWSRRKQEATRDDADAARPASSASPATAGADAIAGTSASPTPVPTPNPTLPPIESLTPESDFTPFFKPDVDPTLKRQALRKLFSDPHFNVMDGLDVYIDDYTKVQPIPPELVATLAHARYVLAPPKTRVNEQGFVEDVPELPGEVSPANARIADESAAPRAPDPQPAPDPATRAEVQAGDKPPAVPNSIDEATPDEPAA